jgi:DNA-binding response OmpR family regulator
MSAVQHRSNRILLLDADTRTSRRLASLLEEDGFQVEVLCDGASALARLSESPLPDTLITELSLPTTDGATVARHASALSPEMRIIVLTRHPHLVHSTSFGSTAPLLLTKPLDLRRLMQFLNGERPSFRRSSRPARAAY